MCKGLGAVTLSEQYLVPVREIKNNKNKKSLDPHGLQAASLSLKFKTFTQGSDHSSITAVSFLTLVL